MRVSMVLIRSLEYNRSVLLPCDKTLMELVMDHWQVTKFTLAYPWTGTVSCRPCLLLGVAGEGGPRA
jgi:hypothetical protein